MNAKTAAAGRKRAQRAILATECERCGATEKLSRHHKDGNPTNNDLANVAILCLSCHTTQHWEEGYRPRKREKVCAACGAAFEYRHSTNKTCSDECRRKLLSEAAKRNGLNKRGLEARWGTIPTGPSLLSSADPLEASPPPSPQASTPMGTSPPKEAKAA